MDGLSNKVKTGRTQHRYGNDRITFFHFSDFSGLIVVWVLLNLHTDYFRTFQKYTRYNCKLQQTPLRIQNLHTATKSVYPFTYIKK